MQGHLVACAFWLLRLAVRTWDAGGSDPETGGDSVPDVLHGSPTVLRMILGRQLQALREKAGLTYQQAAEVIYSSEWTVRRMERAEGGLKPLTVKALLVAYGVTDVREIDTFLALARDASRPGWWHSYSDVLPDWFKVAVGLEESASLIRAYQPQVVPGLLQTEAYVRAITAASFPSEKEDDSERRVALRLARQDLLNRPAPPEYWVVLEETVLRRPIGGSRRHARADRAPDRDGRAAEHHRPGPAVLGRLAPGHVRHVQHLPLPRRRHARRGLQRGA